MQDAEKIVGSLIDKQKICFLTCIDPDGFPSTKAMMKPRKREGIHTLYFSTNTSSNKVTAFRLNPKACLYVFDKNFFCAATLSGTVTVLEDSYYKKMLWEENDTMYYKEGVDDPDYCVLMMTVRKGRYYSFFKSHDFTVTVKGY